MRKDKRQCDDGSRERLEDATLRGLKLDGEARSQGRELVCRAEVSNSFPPGATSALRLPSKGRM